MKTWFTSFWFWVISVFVVILLFMGFVLWDSYQPAQESKSGFDILAEKNNEESAETLIEKITGKKSDEVDVDASFPAPARKLHKLINEPEVIAGDLGDQKLTERIDALNDRLKDINTQLEAQGISVPDSKEIDMAQLSGEEKEVAERLSQIKEFMEQKEQVGGSQ